jgi:hypothetical protein
MQNVKCGSFSRNSGQAQKASIGCGRATSYTDKTAMSYNRDYVSYEPSHHLFVFLNCEGKALLLLLIRHLENSALSDTSAGIHDICRSDSYHVHVLLLIPRGASLLMLSLRDLLEI